MSEVVRHVIAAIADGAAPVVGGARRVVLCVACDHAVVEAGVAFGAQHPTCVALGAIADGSAALAGAARAAGATVVLVDAGVAEPGFAAPSVIALAVGRGGDLSEGAALTPLEATAAIEAGIALVTALAEDGLDVLALGALGAGGDLAAAAVIAALIGGGAALAPADGRDLVARGLAALPPRATPLAILAGVGGRDLAVLTGALLATAARGRAIVLDGVVTTAAALLAASLAPALPGYLIAAHGGGGAAAVAARAALGLTPLLSVGLGHGEGTGAAMVLASLG